MAVVESGSLVASEDVSDSSAGLPSSNCAPLRNSRMELPMERATSGSLRPPKINRMIAKMIDQLRYMWNRHIASLPLPSVYAMGLGLQP